MGTPGGLCLGSVANAGAESKFRRGRRVAFAAPRAYRRAMECATEQLPAGAVAVIFTSRRTRADAAGYAAAAAAMDAEAARQPGYLGMESARDADGFGITISYWACEADAVRWREHAGHAAIRAEGRARWYDRYRVVVAEVTRSYGWRRGRG